MTLPTVTNTLTHFSVYSNSVLTSLTMNGGIPNSLASYTTLDGLYFHSNALTSWPYQNFNATNNIQFIHLHANRKTSPVNIANSGFGGGLSINFINLTKLRQFYAYSNRISNANSSLTNLTSCTLLERFWVYDNLLTEIPTLPNTTSFLDLRIDGNLINTSTNPSAIPSFPNNLQIFYGGFEPAVAVASRTETNTIPTWSVALSSTNLVTFYLQGVNLNSWSTNFPSTIQNIYFDVNLLTTFDFTYCQNVKSFSISNNANTLSSLNNINLATTIQTLICQYNLQMSSPDRFFYPQATSSTRYFPATMTSFNFLRTRISTANQPWSKEIFSTTVVNNIAVVTMQNMNLTSDSVNFILNYFYRLCSTSPAGVSGVAKANSCAPNLVTINIINNVGTIDQNSPPTAGTINGINARTQLIALGVNVT
jgi:hypothetical protein